MPIRDAISGIKITSAVGPATLSATTVGTVIDTRDFDSCLLAIAVGIGGITFTGTNRIDFLLELSDDNSTWTPASQGDVQASYGTTVTVTNGYIKSLTTVKAAADVTKVGYIGGARYIRVTPTFGGTHGTGTPISVNAIMGRSHIQPVA